MHTYLIVSGLCLLLVLHVVCKVWQNALEIHSAADKLDKARDLTARGQQAANDNARNTPRAGLPQSSPPKYCYVW
jgi:type II secretory pathway component PulM